MNELMYNDTGVCGKVYPPPPPPNAWGKSVLDTKHWPVEDSMEL